MATPPSLHVHFRRTGSDQAPACPINYDEVTDRFQIDCSALSPDLADFEARHEGNKYIAKNPHLTTSFSVTEGYKRFVVLEPAERSDQFHPQGFPSEDAAHAYLVKQHTLEVTTPGGYGRGNPRGTLLNLEVGGHGSVGEETTPFVPSTTRTLRTMGEEHAFTAGGIDVSLRLRAPRKDWWVWLSPFVVSGHVAWTKGTVGDDYTARAGEEGDWETWHAGLFLGAQLDAQFFAAAATNTLLSWNAFVRYETPVVAYHAFDIFAALNGRALPEAFHGTDLLTFGDSHLVTVGMTYCAGRGICLGLGPFFRQYDIDSGEVHFAARDFGGLLMIDFLDPMGRGARLPDVVGDTRVTMHPMDPKITPEPEPLLLPVRVPEPEPLPTAPMRPTAKQEFEVSGGATFAQSQSTFTNEGHAQVLEIADKIGTYYRQLVDAGFPPDQQLYISVEGYTNSDGAPEFNQSLSERRAATFLKELQAVIAQRRREAARYRTPAPFPSQILSRAKGYGETELVTRDGVEDKEASRHVTVHVTSQRADFDRALPPTALPAEVAQSDAQLAAHAIARLVTSRGPMTGAFYRPAHGGESATLNLVVPVRYADATAVLGTHAKQTFAKVLTAVRSRAAGFRLMSRHIAVQVLIRPTVAAAGDAVSLERRNAAKSLLFKFDRWPAPGGSEVLELPTPDTDPEQFVDAFVPASDMGLSAAERATYQGILDRRHSVDVFGQAVDLYTLTPIFVDGMLAQETQRLLGAIGQDVIGTGNFYYVDFYYTSAVARMFRVGDSRNTVINTLADAAGNANGLIYATQDDRMPAVHLYIAVTPTALPDPMLLRRAILRLHLPKGQ